MPRNRNTPTLTSRVTSRELYDAVENDNTELVEEILLRAPSGTLDVDTRFRGGKAALHAAVRNNNLKTVSLLRFAGAQAGIKDNHGRTPLHYACAYGASFEIVKVLRLSGADVNEKERWGATPLFRACSAGYWQIIEPLVKLGAHLNVVDDDGNSLLHEASRRDVHRAEEQEHKTAEILLKHGVAIEAKNNRGQTPLSFASSLGRSKIAECLLDNGADVTTRGSDGRTPLHYACRHSEPQTVKLLLERGSAVNLNADDGNTPLHDAVSQWRNMKERRTMARLLLKKGAAWNSQGSDGITPFHAACEANDVRLLQIFLKWGADVGFKNGHGDSPLYCACGSADNVKVVRELVSRGADWSYKSPNNGSTPFKHAFSKNNVRITKYLRQHYFNSLAQEGRHFLHLFLQDAGYSVEGVSGGRSRRRRHVRTAKKVSIRLVTLTIDEFLVALTNITADFPDAITSRDEDHSLPLHIACRTRAHSEVIQFLSSQAVATLSMRDATGKLPVHATCDAGAPLESLKYLVGNGGITLYMMDAAGNLPIHAACSARAPLESIKYLVDSGGIGMLGTRNRDGALPLHLLSKSDPALDAVQYLVGSHPRAVSTRTASGDYPVMLAAQHNASRDVIFELLKAYPNALGT